MQIHVRIKAAGRRKDVLSAVPRQIPDGTASLRQLLTALVEDEVRAFNAKGTEIQLVPYLSGAQIEEQAGTGKVGFGRLWSERKADPDEAVRNAVVFFMTELLYKSLREEEPDQPLFDYVVESLARLQEPAAASYGHFPILFMLRLSHHLGIEPMDNYSAREPLFDLREGCFCYAADNALTPSASLLLHTYLQAIHDDTECPLTTLSQRTELINRLLDYFQLHLSEFHNFKSHEILHTVLQ